MKEIYQRFLSIWKPDFLTKLLQEKSIAPTIKFWIVVNLIATVVISLLVSLAAIRGINTAAAELQARYPEAEIQVQDGKLSTKGIQEPILHEDKPGHSVFVLDTKGERYDSSILDQYEQGTFIGSEKAVYKKNQVEKREFTYKELTQGFSLAQPKVQSWLAEHFWWIKAAIVGGFFLLFLVLLGVVRMVVAFWWALLFWLLGKVMNVKLPYKQVYLATLNFYIIPLLIETVLSQLGVIIPFSTTIIFAALFVMNYMTLSKIEPKPEPVVNPAEPTPIEPTKE